MKIWDKQGWQQSEVARKKSLMRVSTSWFKEYLLTSRIDLLVKKTNPYFVLYDWQTNGQSKLLIGGSKSLNRYWKIAVILKIFIYFETIFLKYTRYSKTWRYNFILAIIFNSFCFL